MAERLLRQTSVAGIVLDQQDIHALSAIETTALSVSNFPDRLVYGQQTARDACRNRRGMLMFARLCSTV